MVKRFLLVTNSKVSRLLDIKVSRYQGNSERLFEDTLNSMKILIGVKVLICNKHQGIKATRYEGIKVPR